MSDNQLADHCQNPAIYLDRRREELHKAMEELSGKPRQAEWEAFMAKFQKSSAEATADEKWQVMVCLVMKVN